MANILLVDDENALTAPLSKALGHQGHTIDVADQGKTGLAMAIAGQYDLLILDWMLPKYQGWRFVVKLGFWVTQRRFYFSLPKIPLMTEWRA